MEKVTPNQGDAVDSVEQVASKDLDLDISQEREMEAARKWIVNRQILPGYPTDRDWGISESPFCDGGIVPVSGCAAG